jgi:MFS family permease
MSGFSQVALLVIGFVLGIALMGFQMASSRFLSPYFGSGIEVWSALISTTMLALMAGYYIGGRVADKAPRSQVLGVVVLAAGLLLAAIPLVKDPILNFTMEQFGDNIVIGAITSSILLMAAPLTLMSFFSPFAVRLLLADAQHGGRVAGSVYSITTIGNIVGTLGGSLWLMPLVGSRDATFVYAAMVCVCGLALIGLRQKATADAN